MKKIVLGKGLDALIGDTVSLNNARAVQVRMIPVGLITSNDYQPRKNFDKTSLEELKKSIEENGIIQPLLVRRAGEAYQLIAGERRLRAARALKMDQVPAIIKVVREKAELLELALIENIQREDLNPLERAESYRRLIKEFGLSQEQVADKVGKERSSVANTLRLLELEPEIKKLIVDRKISFGQAKVLLSLKTTTDRITAARKAVAQGLSVRELEKLVSRRKRISGKVKFRIEKDPHLIEMEAQLREIIKTKVTIVPGKSGRGRIEIEYYNSTELDRICSMIIGYNRI